MKSLHNFYDDWKWDNLTDYFRKEDGDMIKFANDYLEYFLNHLGNHVDFDEFLGLWKSEDIVKEILKRENDTK